jgi:sRNA-binding protein
MDHEFDIQKIIALLAERYPKTFFVAGKKRKLLKVGIYHDLVDDLKGTISAQALSLTLHYYTGDVSYLRATKLGRPRIDLNGDAADAVTHEQRLYALDRLRMIAVARQQRHKAIKEASKAVVDQKKGDGLTSLKAAWKVRNGGSS